MTTPSYTESAPLVTTRTITLRELVQKAWGKEWTKPETVYQFSNGRKFESTDDTDSGIYERN